MRGEGRGRRRRQGLRGVPPREVRTLRRPVGRRRRQGRRRRLRRRRGQDDAARRCADAHPRRPSAASTGEARTSTARAARTSSSTSPSARRGSTSETNALLFDVDAGKKRVVVARGGRGGRGNIHFSTPFDRAPRRAEPGEPGEEKNAPPRAQGDGRRGAARLPQRRQEHVHPRRLARAAQGGRLSVHDARAAPRRRAGGRGAELRARRHPRAHSRARRKGAGLGTRFLKHVERTRALLHLVSLDPGEGREPLADFDVINAELAKFDPELAKRPQIVAMTKADLPDVREALREAREEVQEARGRPEARLGRDGTRGCASCSLRCTLSPARSRERQDRRSDPTAAAQGARGGRQRRERVRGAGHRVRRGGGARAFRGTRARGERVGRPPRRHRTRGGSGRRHASTRCRWRRRCLRSCSPCSSRRASPGPSRSWSRRAGSSRRDASTPKLDRLNPFEGVKGFFSATRLFAVLRALFAGVVVAWLAVRGLGDHIVDFARVGGRSSWIGRRGRRRRRRPRVARRARGARARRAGPASSREARGCGGCA